MNPNDIDYGTYLVVVEKHNRTTIPIKPDFKEIDAALYFLREEMIKVMLKKAKMRGNVTLMSPKERKGWEAFRKVTGEKDIPRYFSFPSMHDIADAGCKFIRKKIVAKKKPKKQKVVKSTEITNVISSLEIL